MPLKFMLAKEFTNDMKLPKELKDNPVPIGWLESEKLDGYRARYDKNKHKFYSRNNKEYIAPKWYINGMPDVDMDGELWIGRNPLDFQAMGTVRKKEPIDEDWMKIKYCVYDFPELNYKFGDRYKIMKKNRKTIKENWNTYRLTLDLKFHSLSCPIIILEQTIVKSMEHMTEYYEKIIENKGEGKC